MSGAVELRGLRLAYGDQPPVLSHVDLDLPGDAMVAVVGPSGSGKTSLLRALAGLTPLQSGRVRLDGVDITDAPPAARPTAMVFQGDSLFPDLSVRDNVAYGLRLRRPAPRDLDERVDVALLQLGLTGLADAAPQDLSGGQARRVALARAWVLRPPLLLLDEPLQGLDAGLRRRLIDLIARTRRRLGGTVVHVTHDLGEALSTADVLVVLRAGEVRQVGPPREVYTHPRDAFVAEFLGPAAILDVPVESARGAGPRRTALIRLLGEHREVPADPGTPDGPHTGTLLARPHALSLRTLPPARVRPEIRGPIGLVQEVRFLGERVDHVVETEAGAILVSGPPQERARIDDYVRIDVDSARLWLLPGR